MRFAAFTITALTALLGTELTAPAQEITVEVNGTNTAAGSFQIATGDWDPSTAKSTAPGLSPDFGTVYVDGGEAASGVFSVGVPADGTYEVFVTWGQSANATDVLYTIDHAEGQATRTLVQDGWGGSMASNANQWISLGAYPFTQGAAQITVAAQPQSQVPHAANVHRIYADAVRLTAADAQPVAATTTPPMIEPATAFIPQDSPPPPIPADPMPTPVESAPAVSPVQPPTPTASAVAWHESLSLARSESLARNRPLAVYAFNHRSRLSRTITDTVLADPGVVAALNELIPVQVDLQQHPQQTGELSIYRVPTLILYSPQGQEIDRLVGRFTAEEVQTLLSRGF